MRDGHQKRISLWHYIMVEHNDNEVRLEILRNAHTNAHAFACFINFYANLMHFSFLIRKTLLTGDLFPMPLLTRGAHGLQMFVFSLLRFQPYSLYALRTVFIFIPLLRAMWLADLVYVCIWIQFPYSTKWIIHKQQWKARKNMINRKKRQSSPLEEPTSDCTKNVTQSIYF